MINRVPLRDAITNMFPATEEEFYQHIDLYQDYNIQYWTVIWYYNERSELIAIRDGDNIFYISAIE